MLDSILAQDLAGIDWEVIVADGMSDDGTRAILDRYARREPRIRVLDNPARAVPAGLNAAIRAARGEIILRMDAHTAYAPDYVRRCLDALQATGAANVGGPARTKPRGYWGRAIAAAYHSPVACGGARFHDPNYEGWADTVPYGCWRKSTLLEIGLFDETLVRNQDDELNLRLCRAGGRVWQSRRSSRGTSRAPRCGGCSSNTSSTASGRSRSSGNTASPRPGATWSPRPSSSRRSSCR